MSGVKDFDREVKEFRDYVSEMRKIQREKFSNADDFCRDRELQKLHALNNVKVYPETRRDLDELKLTVENILSTKKVLSEKDIKAARGTGHYTRDMLLAMSAPPFFLCILPIILLFLLIVTRDPGIPNLNLSDLEDFLFGWVFFGIPTVVTPLALFLMLPAMDSVNKKYGRETDKVSKGIVIASAIGCAVSNAKGMKDGVEKLVNQNGKTEI